MKNEDRIRYLRRRAERLTHELREVDDDYIEILLENDPKSKGAKKLLKKQEDLALVETLLKLEK